MFSSLTSVSGAIVTVLVWGGSASSSVASSSAAELTAAFSCQLDSWFVSDNQTL
jgi:hypothetical protein